MQHTRFPCCLLLILGCAGALVSSQTPLRDQPSRTVEKAGTGVIRGRVVVAGSGTALPRMNVFVYPIYPTVGDASGSPRIVRPLSGTSDDSGLFEIRGLPPGQYTLHVQVPPERPQFISTTYGARGELGRGTRIDVGDDKIVDNIVVEVQRAAVIAGRVVNEFGEPVANVRVVALEVQPGGEPSMMGPSRETDDLGRFRVFGLHPGEYLVNASPTTYEMSGPLAENNQLAYVAAFYPSALTPDEAQRLALEAGQEIADLEITVRRARTYKVSGVVLDSQGGIALRNAQINHSRDASSWSGGMANPDGTFTISGLSPGEHKFVASIGEFGGGGEDVEPEVSRPVTVQVEHDIDDLVLQTRRGARVNGRVVIERGGDSPPNGLEIFVVQPDHSSAGVWVPGASRSATVRANGTFLLRRVFGEVILRVNGVPADRLKSVTYKATDITDAPTEFADVPEPRDLTVVLSDKGAEIRGTVSDEKGLPSEDGVVMLFAADRKRWVSWARSTRQVTLGRSGRFSIKLLRPDKYLIVALDPQERSLLTGGSDVRNFERLAAVATAIEILENDSREIALTIARLPASAR